MYKICIDNNQKVYMSVLGVANFAPEAKFYICDFYKRTFRTVYIRQLTKNEPRCTQLQ
jgi:hypothetical protein